MTNHSSFRDPSHLPGRWRMTKGGCSSIAFTPSVPTDHAARTEQSTALSATDARATQQGRLAPPHLGTPRPWPPTTTPTTTPRTHASRSKAAAATRRARPRAPGGKAGEGDKDAASDNARGGSSDKGADRGCSTSRTTPAGWRPEPRAEGAIWNDAVVRISAKVDYAVRAAIELAVAGDDRPTKADSVAPRAGHPPKFLENILGDLRQAGLVRTSTSRRRGRLPARPARLGDHRRRHHPRRRGPAGLGARRPARGRRLRGQRRAAAARLDRRAFVAAPRRRARNARRPRGRQTPRRRRGAHAGPRTRGSRAGARDLNVAGRPAPAGAPRRPATSRRRAHVRDVAAAISSSSASAARELDDVLSVARAAPARRAPRSRGARRARPGPRAEAGRARPAAAMSWGARAARRAA